MKIVKPCSECNKAGVVRAAYLNCEKPLATGLQLTTCKLTTSQLPQLVHKVRGRYGIADLVGSNQVGQLLCCIYRWASKLKPTKLEGLRAKEGRCMLQNFEAVSVFPTETIEHKGFDDLNIQRGLVIFEI